MDNLIIMGTVIEKQRRDHKNFYIVWTYNKLWMNDSLIVMERIGFSKKWYKSALWNQ